VNLPVGLLADFPTVEGPATAAAHPFNIDMQCEAAVGDISYYVSPLTPIHKSHRMGVVTVQGAGSAGVAQGVGIQFLRADGSTPVWLGETIRFDTLPPSAGGAWSQRFHARYYRLDPAIDPSAGRADTAIQFMLIYP
jgi:type 1 fimbria pilin